MMNKVIALAIVLFAAIAITACGGDEPAPAPAPEPVAPTPPPPPPAPELPEEEEGPEQAAPVETEAQVLDDAREILGGGDMQILGSKIGEVGCDEAEQKVTFTFENTGIYTWSLDQEIGFTTQGDVRNVKVFMNHRYEMNSGKDQYHPATSELMFGPNDKFSDNCGGVTELAPGEAATCTLLPVPLNEGSGSNDLTGVNYILIDSPSVDDLIEFTC